MKPPVVLIQEQKFIFKRPWQNLCKIEQVLLLPIDFQQFVMQRLILVMNKGSIIEMGNHKELLEKGGFYADLYNSQFTGANLEDKAV